jgi:hypothetical protein
MNYLSICAIIKDEHPEDILEWIEYHHKIGIEHFYLYDNDSEVPLTKCFGEVPYITIKIINGSPVQYLAYKDCIEQLQNGNSTRWLAIIDSDEFICPTNVNYLPTLLGKYEKFAGLSINWAMFGGNGILKHQESILKSYIKRMDFMAEDETHQICQHVKTIIDPTKVVGISHPHNFHYQDNWYSVGEDFNKVEDFARIPITYNKIKINHYYTKSKEDYDKKVLRPRADVGSMRQNVEYIWNLFEKTCTIEDTRILEIMGNVT